MLYASPRAIAAVSESPHASGIGIPVRARAFRQASSGASKPRSDRREAIIPLAGLLPSRRLADIGMDK
jgi:hypothetical protein